MSDKFELHKNFPIRNHINDLSGEDAEIAEAIQDSFTWGVEGLRDECPSPILRELGEILWFAVNKRIVDVAAVKSVENLTLWIEQVEAESMAVIMLPLNYPEQCYEDPVSEISRVINAASKIKDYLFGRFEVDDVEVIEERAKVYEAEALAGLSNDIETQNLFQLSDAGKEILTKYPEGFKSMPDSFKYQASLSMLSAYGKVQ